jgi:hypothetical protein
MPINAGLFIGLDGTTFIRHVHATIAAYEPSSPESPRFERTTRLDPGGRVIFKQQPCLPGRTLISDPNNAAVQARKAAKKS